MELTDDDVREFADLCEKEFSVRPTPDDARRGAALFLELCFLLVQPLPGEPGFVDAPLVTL
jgi:hypothetical protein